MTIYYMLLAFAVVIVALVLILVVVTVKNTEKDEPSLAVEQKKDEMRWNHIKDFADINSSNSGKMHDYGNSVDEEVMTTGVGMVTQKKNTAQEPATSDLNKMYASDDETKSMNDTLCDDFKDETVPMTQESIDVILNYNDGNGSKVLKMTSDRLTVGRDVSNDLILWNNSYLGRWHAELAIRDNKLYLTDKNSKNGTFVDGQRIMGEVELKGNCAVRFGNTVVSVMIDRKMCL